MSDIDDQERREIEKRLKESVSELHKLAPMLGHAKQVKEFSSDQRKNVLAAVQMPYIQRGESVAGSETLARANPVYTEKLAALAKDYEDACAIQAKWDATMARYEAARSLLSMVKETMHLV